MKRDDGDSPHLGHMADKGQIGECPTHHVCSIRPKAFEENLKRLAATDAEVSANPEKIHALTPERWGRMSRPFRTVPLEKNCKKRLPTRTLS